MNNTIEHLSRQIESRRLSPVHLTQQCLLNIEKHHRLNAFITVLKTEAIEAAKIAEAEIDSGRYKGPLHGIPVAIKDFYDTAGIRTTAGFKHFDKRVPAKDAPVVTRLKEAGAIIIGKTNMHKLGMGTTSIQSDYGSVCNPWNINFIAGGSSGGSAVAVVTGMCMATIDTDVVGSCRIPAACCGVVGFKPTYGVISNAGILEGEPVEDMILKLSHVGITTQSVHDSRTVYTILAGRLDDNKNVESLTSMGMVTNFEASGTVRQLFDVFINQQVGRFSFKSIELPFQQARFSAETIDHDRSYSEDLFKETKLVVLPTLTTNVMSIQEAKKLGDQALSPANTFFANYYGLPSISIPVTKDSNGLPFGIQLIAAAGEESLLLNVAARIEESTAWKQN